MKVADLKRLEQALESNRKDFLPGMNPKIYFRVRGTWRTRKRTVYAGSILEIIGLNVQDRKVDLLTHKGVYRTAIKNGEVDYDYTGEPVILYNGKSLDQWDKLKEAQEQPVEFFDKLGQSVLPGDTVTYAPATRGPSTLEIDVVDRLILGKTGLVTIVFKSGRRFSRAETEYDQKANQWNYTNKTEALVVLKRDEKTSAD